MNRFFFLVLLLVGYSLFFILRFPLWYHFTLFSAGLLIGYLFHVVDRIVQLFGIPEFQPHRKSFVQSLMKGKITAAMQGLLKNVHSVSSTFYFLVLYFPLSLYLITSSGSVLGTGLVLGLGISYVAHFILSYKNVKDVRRQYFEPVSKKVSDTVIQRIMGVFILCFVVLSVIVVVL